MSEQYQMILHVGAEEMTFLFVDDYEALQLIGMMLETAVDGIDITIWKGDKD